MVKLDNNKNSRWPLVTTTVLVYKKFDKLFSALKSIIDQDYPNIEIVISDDSSGNFPLEEVKKFIYKNKKSNIKNIEIIINESNLGTVKNLNNALKKGNGEYFIGLPGDDVFYDNSVISKVVDRFLTTNASLVVCSRLKCSEQNMTEIRLMPDEKFIKKINKLKTLFAQYQAFGNGRYYEMASGSSTYFSKKHFKEWGYFDEKYVLWEDGPFFAQYLRAGNEIHKAYDIISIRYREGGISNSAPHPLMIKDYETFIKEEYFSYINKFNYLNSRMIKFLYKRNDVKSNKVKTFFLYLNYFDCILIKLTYRFYCNHIDKKRRGDRNGLL